MVTVMPCVDINTQYTVMPCCYINIIYCIPCVISTNWYTVYVDITCVDINIITVYHMLI